MKKSIIAVVMLVVLSVNFGVIAEEKNQISFAETINPKENTYVLDIEYMNGTYVLTGTNGLLCVSHNMFDWIKIDLGIEDDILKIRSNENIFAAIGRNFALTSVDGYNWQIIYNENEKEHFLTTFYGFDYQYHVVDTWFCVLKEIEGYSPQLYCTQDFKTFVDSTETSLIYSVYERDKFEQETGYTILKTHVDEGTGSVIVFTYNDTGSMVFKKEKGSDSWEILGDISVYEPIVGNNPRAKQVKVMSINNRTYVFRESVGNYFSDDGINFVRIDEYKGINYKLTGDYLIQISENEISYTTGDYNRNTVKISYRIKPTYEKEAQSLQAAGLLQGNEKGLDLLKPLNRIEATTILVRALGLENTPTETVSKFADIPDDNWGVKYANIAYDAGITRGIGDNKFAPDDLITGDQFATLLLRNSESEEFDWQTAINILIEKNIITPENAETMDLFTRGDMAKIIYEAREKGLIQ